MKIYVLRHGETQYNAEKRYQGQRDIPLSDKGRAVETAHILFPGAQLVPVEGFREMCFGIFEGRNYIEMEHDADYRAWVGEDCMGRCPGGETRAEFSARTCGAFSALVDRALAEGADTLVILAHGGTQMALMERYADPKRDYYSWCAGNAAGFVLDAGRWRAEQRLELVGEVSYAGDE